MKDEVGLRLAILFVQQALISSYEHNCPLKLVRTGKHDLKWTHEFKCLRREVRPPFNMWLADETSQSLELYTEGQRRYRKDVRP